MANASTLTRRGCHPKDLPERLIPGGGIVAETWSNSLMKGEKHSATASGPATGRNGSFSTVLAILTLPN